MITGGIQEECFGNSSRVSVISTQKLSRTSEQTENLAGKPNSKETSLPQMGNLVVENGHLSWCFAPKIGGSYSGTGDLFASVLSAGLVKEMSMMLRRTGGEFSVQGNCPDGTGRNRPE